MKKIKTAGFLLFLLVVTAWLYGNTGQTDHHIPKKITK
jgi:hypothetical protein